MLFVNFIDIVVWNIKAVKKPKHIYQQTKQQEPETITKQGNGTTVRHHQKEIKKLSKVTILNLNIVPTNVSQDFVSKKQVLQHGSRSKN